MFSYVIIIGLFLTFTAGQTFKWPDYDIGYGFVTHNFSVTILGPRRDPTANLIFLNPPPKVNKLIHWSFIYTPMYDVSLAKCDLELYFNGIKFKLSRTFDCLEKIDKCPYPANKTFHSPVLEFSEQIFPLEGNLAAKLACYNQDGNVLLLGEASGSVRRKKN